MIFSLRRQAQGCALQPESKAREEAQLGITLYNQLPACLGLNLLFRQLEQCLLVDKHGHQQHRQDNDCYQCAYDPENHQHLAFP